MTIWADIFNWPKMKDQCLRMYNFTTVIHYGGGGRKVINNIENCNFISFETLKMSKGVLKPSQLIYAFPIVITTFQTTNCFFIAGSFQLTTFILNKSFAISVVMRHATIPTEMTRRGYSIEVNSFFSFQYYDPNKRINELQTTLLQAGNLESYTTLVSVSTCVIPPPWSVASLPPIDLGEMRRRC